MEKKLYVRKEDVKPTIREGGRQSRLMIAPKFTDAKGFAVGYQIMPPGTVSTEHQHEVEQEAFFVVKGTGYAIVGDQKFDIGPETAWVAPATVPHSLYNTGDDDLMFIWCYCPPLPSQVND